MKRDLFAISTYCSMHGIDRSFITSLESEGLIHVTSQNQDEFIDEEQLHELEIYTRWYNELGINPEGIDAIRHLVNKLRTVQAEINYLKNKLRLYEHDSNE
jgi:MerR family transcriptional regulator/heat shock protein HspR